MTKLCNATTSPIVGTRRQRVIAVVLTMALIAACGGASGGTTTLLDGSGTTEPVALTTTTRSTSSVVLEAPSEVGANTNFTVKWTGPNNDGDYVTIVARDSAEGTYESYFDTRLGPEGTLLAPDSPGEYEIWYVDGESSATLARLPITVLDFVVTLDATTPIEAGSEFQVTWTGPDGPGDYVTIVATDSAEGTYESYFDTNDGSPGTLVAPIAQGTYEIRYASGQSQSTLSSITVTVVPFSVTLEAPAEVGVSTAFQISWTGPDGPGDYITIVPAGSPAGAYLDYQYVSTGTPLQLTAPADPGEYEIRYQSDRVPDLIFASIPITVR